MKRLLLQAGRSRFFFPEIHSRQPLLRMSLTDNVLVFRQNKALYATSVFLP